MAERWNPWAELRARPHIELIWARIPNGSRGAWIPFADGQAAVVLDHRLRRVERRAVLGHELVHDERGIAYRPSTPAELIVKEERAVNLEVARRLVPLDELVDFVKMRVSVEAVTAHDVAAEFDVPVGVAEIAINLIRRVG